MSMISSNFEDICKYIVTRVHNGEQIRLYHRTKTVAVLCEPDFEYIATPVDSDVPDNSTYIGTFMRCTDLKN